jgi:hypothetical protein
LPKKPKAIIKILIFAFVHYVMVKAASHITPKPASLERKEGTDSSGTHLKKVDQGSGQGAVRRKSGAYTLFCEHFEPSRNTAMSTQTLF